jgi:hypothetical protein
MPRTTDKINEDIQNLNEDCQNRLNVLNNELTEAQAGTDNGDEEAETTAADVIPETVTDMSGDGANPSVGQTEEEYTGTGGRRRSRRRGFKGSKKGKTRKGNKMLSSWVAFVKKVQKEEQISYSQAMKRASARKKEWKMGQMGGAEVGEKKPIDSSGSFVPTGSTDSYVPTDTEIEGGRRRRRSKRRGSKKRRGSRRR